MKLEVWLCPVYCNGHHQSEAIYPKVTQESSGLLSVAQGLPSTENGTRDFFDNIDSASY
jgi:hypothetical protein